MEGNNTVIVTETKDTDQDSNKQEDVENKEEGFTLSNPEPANIYETGKGNQRGKK